MSEPTSIEAAEDEIGLTCGSGQNRSILSTLRNGHDRIDEVYEHGILRFLTMKEARKLRLVCHEFLDNVLITPFSDLESPIGREGVPIQESLVLYRQCYPRAVAANVKNRYDLVDADFALFRGFQALDISRCYGITGVAFSHLRGIKELTMKGCVQDSITPAAFLQLRGITSLNVSREIHPLIVAIESDNTPEKLWNILRLIKESPPLWINARYWINTIRSENTNWITPLHRSCFLEIETVTLCLLQHGADTSIVDVGGETPLHYAASCGNQPIVLLLLEWGANVNARDNEGATPLYLACLHAEYDTALLLLKWGAHVNALCKGFTRIASLLGYPHLARLLNSYRAIE